METRNGRGRTPTWSAPFNGATALRRRKPAHSRAPGSGCNPFNGATALRRWKLGVRRLQIRRARQPSMEPPPFGDGNSQAGKQSRDDVGTVGILQWSHRPSAMETVARPYIGLANVANGATALRTHFPSGPSMEPPPFGDGNSPYGNGAGANGRRWKPGRNRPLFGADLQWSHRPSAMETPGGTHAVSPGHALRRWKRPGTLMSFNGATALRRWKPGRWRTDPSSSWDRSPFNGATALRRWKPSCSLVAHPNIQAFNGATALRRWKRARSCHRNSWTFNGATALRRWKRRPMNSALRTIGLQWSHRPSAMETPDRFAQLTSGSCVPHLQWSHRPSAMETSPRRERRVARKPSSPFLQWSHRPSAMETCKDLGCTFNGATALRRWPWVIVAVAAFNGATALRRWKPGSLKGLFAREVGWVDLQWSHRPSAMENLARINRTGQYRSLQWSHRPSAMETRPDPDNGAYHYYLQWSHRPSAMET